MIIGIIAGLVIYTAIWCNINVVFFAYVFSTGGWVKEIIIEAYTDFKDSLAWVLLILNIGCVISIIYFIIR